MPVATLYPAYVRGQAYLAAGNARKALTEFQKFSGHSGLVANYPWEPWLDWACARLFAHRRHSEGAPGLQEFFQLWKDADPDIPILRKAKAEHAKLH